MVYGHDGFAGELGHVIARRDGRLCGCGRKGCLETYCSATGVARTAREFFAARTDASLLRNICLLYTSQLLLLPDRFNRFDSHSPVSGCQSG